LIAVESGNGHVEEESVQDSRWNVSQRIGQQEEREADEEVRNHARQSRLAHFHNTARKITRLDYDRFLDDKWQLVLIHFVDVSLVDSFLDIGQAADVQRRVWQGGVHPRQTE